MTQLASDIGLGWAEFKHAIANNSILYYVIYVIVIVITFYLISSFKSSPVQSSTNQPLPNPHHLPPLDITLLVVAIVAIVAIAAIVVIAAIVAIVAIVAPVAIVAIVAITSVVTVEAPIKLIILGPLMKINHLT